MEAKFIIGTTLKRKQKVYYGHYGYEGGYFHPLIRIGGKYLKEFDFNVGDPIEISVAMGKITISKAPVDSLPP